MRSGASPLKEPKSPRLASGSIQLNCSTFVKRFFSCIAPQAACRAGTDEDEGLGGAGAFARSWPSTSGTRHSDCARLPSVARVFSPSWPARGGKRFVTRLTRGAARDRAGDTNILVYTHREDWPWPEAACGRLAELAEGRAAWAIPWPCLHEFLAIVTHPRIYNPPSLFMRAKL